MVYGRQDTGPLSRLPYAVYCSIKIMRSGRGLGDAERQDALGFHGNHIVLILQLSFNEQELLTDNHQTVLRKQIWSDDGIGDASLIFEAEEDEALGGAGPLARDYGAGDSNLLAVGNALQLRRRADAQGLHLRAAIGHGMRAEGEPRAREVRHQALLGSHDGKGRSRLAGCRRPIFRRLRSSRIFKQLSRRPYCSLHLPQSIPPMAGTRGSGLGSRESGIGKLAVGSWESSVVCRRRSRLPPPYSRLPPPSPHKIQRAHLRQGHQFRLSQLEHALRQIVNRGQRTGAALADNGFGSLLPQSFHIVHSQPQEDGSRESGVGSGSLRVTSPEPRVPIFFCEPRTPNPEPCFSRVTTPESRLPFQGASPAGARHVNRPHPEPMTLRVLHDHRWTVKAHRLIIQQGSGERGRVMTFEIGAGVGNEGEAGGVRLRKTVKGEGGDRLHDFVLRFADDSLLVHASPQLLFDFLHAHLRPL